MRSLLLLLVLCVVVAARFAHAQDVAIDPRAVIELMPLAIQAAEIYERATAREALHVEELRKKGIAELPPDATDRHVIDVPGLQEIGFNDWGELYIDRRFVTDEEMKTVLAIERWIAKWCKGEIKKHRVEKPTKATSQPLPVFRGFESPRYQQHDALIVKLTDEFNASKAAWCGGTAAQASEIEKLSPAVVKAHMIEESGGNGARSKAAWVVDPLQVNVPGDWGEEKELVGLQRPMKRNEGTVEQNVKAAIMYLSRKGFSAAARPAAERPKGFFDGWLRALQRYNGRRDRTDTDRYYSDEYADKILRRAQHPDTFVPIEIKLKK